MVNQKIIINNPSGLHLRPAGNLCNEAMKYQSAITFEFEGGTAGLLGGGHGGVDDGDLVLRGIVGAHGDGGGDGADEQEAMKALTDAISGGLGE